MTLVSSSASSASKEPKSEDSIKRNVRSESFQQTKYQIPQPVGVFRLLGRLCCRAGTQAFRTRSFADSDKNMLSLAAMLETLSKGFRLAREKLTGQAELTEENIDAALRDVRMSLLEADVAPLPVVPCFYRGSKTRR